MCTTCFYFTYVLCASELSFYLQARKVSRLCHV